MQEFLTRRGYYQPALFWKDCQNHIIILVGRAGDLAIVKIRAKIKGKIDQIEKMLDEKFNFNKLTKAIQQPYRKKVPATQ